MYVMIDTKFAKKLSDLASHSKKGGEKISMNFLFFLPKFFFQ